MVVRCMNRNGDIIKVGVIRVNWMEGQIINEMCRDGKINKKESGRTITKYSKCW